MELDLLTGTYSLFYVLNTNNGNSLNPFVCGTQTLNSIEVRDYTSVSSFAVNNSPTYATRAWAFYGEGHQITTQVGAVYAAELDVRTIAQFTAIDPYTPETTQVAALQIASGAGYTGFQYNTSAAINIQNNNSQFNMGIVFGSTSIVGGGSSTGIALALAQGHIFQWYGSSGVQTSSIRCYGSTASNGVILNFGEGFVRFENASNPAQILWQLNIQAGAANYIQTYAALTGAAPEIIAAGTDTNINLLLSGKGSGLVSFGTFTSGTFSQTGYITIADSGGVTRRLMVG